MKVRDIMSSPVITVPEDASVIDVINLFLAEDIGCVCVGESGTKGFITNTDILAAVVASSKPNSQITAADIMTANLITTSPDSSVASVVRLMDLEGITRLPVVDDIEIVGVVTITDISAAQPEQIAEAYKQTAKKDEWTD